MNKIKEPSFTSKRLEYLERYYTELDNQLNAKNNELYNTIKDITYLTEIIDVFQKLEENLEEKKAKRKTITLASIVGAIVGSIVTGIAGASFPVVLGLGAVVFSIGHFILPHLVFTDLYSKYLEEKLNLYKEELDLPDSLNCDLAQTMVKQKESVRDELHIEINSLKQKTEYFKNIIGMVDFYLDFHFLQEQYDQYVSLMQHNPCLSQIIKETEEFAAQNERKKYLDEWEKYLAEPNTYKSVVPEKWDIPTVELKNVKKLELEK